MALFDDLFKGGNIITGLAIGLGVTVVLPMVLPLIRPVAKGVIKTGLMVYDQAASAVAELGDHAGDLVAEAQHEHYHNEHTHGLDEGRERDVRGFSKEEPLPPNELSTSPGTA